MGCSKMIHYLIQLNRGFFMISRIIMGFSIIMLLITFLSIPAAGEVESVNRYNGFEYQLMDDGSGVEITGYTGWESLVIPARIEGEPVVKIGGFKKKELIEVTIPDSVTWISYEAFKDNTLTKVTIPDSVTHLGRGAFWRNQLKEVTLSKNLTIINSYTFLKNNLTEIIIPDSVTEIGAWAFTDNKLTKVSMSNNTEIIGARSFSNNQLKEIIIPNRVTSIEEDAFYRNQLTEVTIPNSVTSIGDGAFAENQLSKVTIPGSVTWIADDAFDNNQENPVNLTIFGIRGSVAESFARTKGYRFIHKPLPEQYTLTINKEGQGTTSPATGEYDHDKNTPVTVTATPASGWEFQKWTVNGEEKSTSSITLTMDEDATVIAHFVESKGDNVWTEFTEKYHVPLDKEWLIIFNRVFSVDEIKEIQIERDDNDVDITLSIIPEDKQVRVEPHAKYLPGERYRLKISLKSFNYFMYFNTVEETDG